MQRTLGGDRLGSGKKMDIQLHGYSRSNHDLGYIWRSTMASGTLVPFLKQVALPGDTFDIDLECDVKTHPTIGPLFGSYKIQLDVFQIPIRLYNSLMHNNTLGIGMDMSQVKLPVIRQRAFQIEEMPDDLDNFSVNQSCILSYLGLRGIGVADAGFTRERTFNAVPLLMYWDIYKNYYANKQEGKGAVIHVTQPVVNQTVDTVTVNSENIPEYPTETPTSPLTVGDLIEIAYTGTAPEMSTLRLRVNGTWRTIPSVDFQFVSDVGGVQTFQFNGINGSIITAWAYINSVSPEQARPEVVLFDLEKIDEMRQDILAFNSKTNPFMISTDNPHEPYTWLCDSQEGIMNRTSSQEGLGIKTYQSDLFNNWLETEWVDGINDASAVSTVGDLFTIDQLNLSKKVYDLLNRIAVSGGSYDDWQDATWAHERYKKTESPMYEGGLIRELVFQEVFSTAEAGNQPLGTLAGRGIMAQRRKGGKIVVKVDEPSYIMGIVSLTPRIDYSQGNDWDLHLETMNDLHKPALDGIGFQDLITEQMAWWSTHYDGGWIQKSAGKQPAWLNYMTNVNKTYGNFAYKDSEMFMTLNRRYEANITTWEIDDLTTYIDPAKFNFIFAETALDAQNFWVQISVDIEARRKMSAKVIPNL